MRKTNGRGCDEYRGLEEARAPGELKSVQTFDELVALAREEGMELTDEQLKALSGGDEWYEPIPPCRKAGPCTTLG